MNFIQYHIDEQKNLLTDTLEIKVSTKGVSKESLLKKVTANDAKILNFLERFASRQANVNEGLYFSISYKHSYEAFEFLTQNSDQIYFKDKKISCDLYGKNSFIWNISHNDKNELFATGKIITRSSEIALEACDLIGRLNSGFWFIKGIILRFVSCEPFWSDIPSILEKKALIDEDFIERLHSLYSESPSAVVFEGSSYHVALKQQQPLPLLMLKDKKGAFAQLWLDYGKGRLVAYHDSSLVAKAKDGGQCKRAFDQEKLWEKDLLETDYIYKPVGTTKYYCPTDKISASLLFLLELGWNVVDFNDRKIVHMSDKPQLSWHEVPEAVALRGTLSYGEQTIPIEQVVGAFNRRESFVTLSEKSVGLLPNSFQDTALEGLLGEIEFVAGEIQIAKNRAHLIDIEKNSAAINQKKLKSLLLNLSRKEALENAPTTSFFNGSLRPYQQQGVDWLAFLYKNKFNGLLADDMGLGKTVQLLAFISRLKTSDPILVVAPTSLLFNWQLEIEKFLPSFAAKTLTHQGAKRAKTAAELKTAAIILVSFATLRADVALFSALNFAALLVDEAQGMKNSQSQLFRALCQLKADFKVSITGTPIENNLQELWSHFHFLMPNLLGQQKVFAAESSASSLDSRHLQKIKKLIRPFILRRDKKSVADDLPDIIEQIVYVELNDDQRQLYESFLSAARKKLIGKVRADGLAKHRMEVFEQLLRLRQICADPLIVASQLALQAPPESSKKALLLSDIETIIAEGGKALIYSQFTSVLQILSKELIEAKINFAYLDGSTKERSSAVKKFQENEDVKLFLISLKAGGVGLNLTAADTVFLLDPWWNDAVEQQAIARAHRIGQKQTVFAKKYIAAETIEEKMVKMKAAKKELAHQLLGQEEQDEGELLKSFSEEDLSFLLE